MRGAKLQFAGMTLVELLVGMAIATLMTVAGWRAIEALQTARDQTFRDATQWQSLDTFFSTLESDLRRADYKVFSGDGTSISLRLNPLTQTEPLRTVRYRWVAINENLVRVVRQSDDGEIALTEGRNARFSYRVPTNAGAASASTAGTAATSAAQVSELPKAVEIAIELLGNANETGRIINRTLVVK